MSITRESELIGMQKVSFAVAYTLKAMMQFAQPGMTTKMLDDYGAKILTDFGARSAPKLTYGFPGCCCISVNQEFCHGIPHNKRILQEGDLINIDVSAELEGFWADNGASFVLGKDIHEHASLVEASKTILEKAIREIKTGVKIADIGAIIETEAKKRGYSVVKNLGGHGVGRSLHEPPHEIMNFRNRLDRRKFSTNLVVAVETFISTSSHYAVTQKDGWTMIGNKGGFMAQHEHTIVVTEEAPMILTMANDIFI